MEIGSGDTVDLLQVSVLISEYLRQRKMKGSQGRKRNFVLPHALRARCAFGAVRASRHDITKRNKTKTCVKSRDTVETRIKEPAFIRTLRLKFISYTP